VAPLFAAAGRAAVRRRGSFAPSPAVASVFRGAAFGRAAALGSSLPALGSGLAVFPSAFAAGGACMAFYLSRHLADPVPGSLAALLALQVVLVGAVALSTEPWTEMRAGFLKRYATVLLGFPAFFGSAALFDAAVSATHAPWLFAIGALLGTAIAVLVRPRFLHADTMVRPRPRIGALGHAALARYLFGVAVLTSLAGVSVTTVSSAGAAAGAAGALRSSIIMFSATISVRLRFCPAWSSQLRVWIRPSM